MISLSNVNPKAAQVMLARTDMLTMLKSDFCPDYGVGHVKSGPNTYMVIITKEQGKVVAVCNHAHVLGLGDVPECLCRHIAFVAHAYKEWMIGYKKALATLDRPAEIERYCGCGAEITSSSNICQDCSK